MENFFDVGAAKDAISLLGAIASIFALLIALRTSK